MHGTPRVSQHCWVNYLPFVWLTGKPFFYFILSFDKSPNTQLGAMPDWCHHLTFIINTTTPKAALQQCWPLDKISHLCSNKIEWKWQQPFRHLYQIAKKHVIWMGGYWAGQTRWMERNIALWLIKWLQYPLHKCTVDPIPPAICEKNIFCFICPTTQWKITVYKELQL